MKWKVVIHCLDDTVVHEDQTWIQVMSIIEEGQPDSFLCRITIEAKGA